MNTKVCAVLFAGSTLASSNNEEKTLAVSDDNQSLYKCAKTGLCKATNYVVNEYSRLKERSSENRTDAAYDANVRTNSLKNLVKKLRVVIEELQKPAGCEQNAQEMKEVQDIIKKALDAVVKSMKDFEKNLPQSAVAWMDNAKVVLTNFSQKINGQPTEEDIKGLMNDLDIKKLKDVVESVKGDATVKDEDKNTMLVVQDIVAPLQDATDIESFLEILETKCIRKMEALTAKQTDVFIETAEDYLESSRKVAKYFKCVKMEI